MATTTDETTVTFKTEERESGPFPVSAIAEATDKVRRGELFDGTTYDTPVPRLDGHRADTVKLAFAGAVEIDLHDNHQLDHFRALRLGQEIELHITARVAKNTWAHRIADPETGEENVVHQIGVAVVGYDVDEAAS